MKEHNPVEGRRSKWGVALATHPRARLLEIAETFAAKYEALQQTVPKAGLAMLCLRDSVLGEPFNLGEIPLSSARVKLLASDGREAEGAASLMVDDAELATALAICDAVLSEQFEGWRDVAELVEAGLKQLDAVDHGRRSILNRSRVEFSLLNQDS